MGRGSDLAGQEVERRGVALVGTGEGVFFRVYAMRPLSLTVVEEPRTVTTVIFQSLVIRRNATLATTSLSF